MVANEGDSMCFANGIGCLMSHAVGSRSVEERIAVIHRMLCLDLQASVNLMNVRAQQYREQDGDMWWLLPEWQWLKDFDVCRQRWEEAKQQGARNERALQRLIKEFKEMSPSVHAYWADWFERSYGPDW